MVNLKLGVAGNIPQKPSDTYYGFVISFYFFLRPLEIFCSSLLRLISSSILLSNIRSKDSQRQPNALACKLFPK